MCKEGAVHDENSGVLCQLHRHRLPRRKQLSAGKDLEVPLLQLRACQPSRHCRL